MWWPRSLPVSVKPQMTALAPKGIESAHGLPQPRATVTATITGVISISPAAYVQSSPLNCNQQPFQQARVSSD